MSIAHIVTRGFGNGTLVGNIGAIVGRGFTNAIEWLGPLDDPIEVIANVEMTPVDFTPLFSSGSFIWDLTGTLPSGLTFASGTLSGEPLELGTFSGLVVMITDALDRNASSPSFSIRVIAYENNLARLRGMGFGMGMGFGT